MVANTYCTPPSSRFPSRETLAAAAATAFEAAASADPPGPPSGAAVAGKNLRRGSFSPGVMGMALGADVAGEPAIRAGSAGSGASPQTLSAASSPGHRKSWRSASAWRKDKGGAVGAEAPADRVASRGWAGLISPPFATSPFPDISGSSRSYNGSIGSGSGIGPLGSVAGGVAGGDGHGVGRSSSGIGGFAGLNELDERNVVAVRFIVVRVGWAGAGRLALEVTGLRAEATPAPTPGLPPFFELPTLR